MERYGNFYKKNGNFYYTGEIKINNNNIFKDIEFKQDSFNNCNFYKINKDLDCTVTNNCLDDHFICKYENYTLATNFYETIIICLNKLPQFTEKELFYLHYNNLMISPILSEIKNKELQLFVDNLQYNNVEDLVVKIEKKIDELKRVRITILVHKNSTCLDCNSIDFDNFQFAEENSFTNVLIADAIRLIDRAEKLQKKVILKFYFSENYSVELLIKLANYSLDTWLFESHGIAYRISVDKNIYADINCYSVFVKTINNRKIEKGAYYFNENIKYIYGYSSDQIISYSQHDHVLFDKPKEFLGSRHHGDVIYYENYDNDCLIRYFETNELIADKICRFCKLYKIICCKLPKIPNDLENKIKEYNITTVFSCY